MRLQKSLEEQLEEQFEPLLPLLGMKRIYCNHCGQTTGLVNIEADGTSLCFAAICILSGETGRVFLPLTPEQEQSVMDTYNNHHGGNITLTYKEVPGSENVQFVSIESKEEAPKEKTRESQNKKNRNNGPADPDADGAGQAAGQPAGQPER